MIKIIHKNTNAKNIIVFIHGFIGGEDTWVKKNGERPFIEPILEDNIISKNFDIGVFEYHTKLVEFFSKTKSLIKSIWNKKKTVKNSSIEDISKILSTSLEYKCAEYDNIILISHSMGGLIAKRYVLDDIIENTVSRVKLYISLATPHSGSNLATLGSMILGNNQVSDMEPLSENIRKLNDEWIKCKSLPFRIYAQGMSDEIVPKESSIALDAEKQKVIYSNDNHSSIIIPDNENDNILLAIKSELLSFYQKDEIDSIDLNEVFEDKGQYDEEVFVLKLLMADVHDILISSSKQAFFSAEFAVRKLNAMGVDLRKLSPLYEKIKEIYSIEFGNLLTGIHKDSNAFVNAVHKNIMHEDKNYLSTLYHPLQALQKYGMLHQLSRTHDDIWWAIDNNIRTLIEFKEKIEKKKSEL